MFADIHLFNILWVILIGIILCFAYFPGVNLFFRSDDWEAISVLEIKSRSLRGIKEFIAGTQHYFTKHFYPIGNVILLLKFLIFGNKYGLHFIFSLYLHITNVVLIYLVGSEITGNTMVGLTAAIFFAFNNVIIDTVLWPVMFFQILSITFIFSSILFHPLIADTSQLTNILFYISIYSAPLIYEIGLLAPVIAIAIFVINDQLNLSTYLINLLPVIIYFTGRRLINGTFGMSDKQRGEHCGKIAFIGIGNTVYHIAVGIIKVILGFFSCKFKIVIYEALFILKLRLKEPVTIIGCLISLYLLFSIWVFVNNDAISIISKWYSLGFVVMACCHFFIMSFNVQPWNREYDPVRQASTTPHQMYPPSSFLAIPVAYIMITSQPDLVFILMLSVFVVVNGVYTIREQINIVRTHTDSMKDSLKIFKDNGSLPYRGRRYLMEHYRLDGMFRNDMVAGYLKLGDRNFTVRCADRIKVLKVYIESFDTIDMVWDFYKIINILNDYNLNKNDCNKLQTIKFNLKEQMIKCGIIHNEFDENGIVGNYDVNYLNEHILIPYIRKILTKLHPDNRKSKYLIDDNSLKDNEIVNYYSPLYVELNILVPRIQGVIAKCRREIKDLNKDKIVKILSERDHELSSYVGSVLEESSRRFAELKGRPILIWGAGGYFTMVKDIFSDIDAFIDNNPLKHGKCFNNVPVKPPSYLYNSDLPIFICSAYKEEIYHQIKNEYPHVVPNIIHYIPVVPC